jgi:hypothetical protein
MELEEGHVVKSLDVKGLKLNEIVPELSNSDGWDATPLPA